MTPDSSPRIGLHPSIVLPAYVEPLIRGRRVAVLGDATVGLAEELAQRGARLVHAYDPDPARAAEALAKLEGGRTHQISYAVLAGDLGVRDGAFDAVIVPDLSIFLDPAELMRRVRKLCAASGVAVIVAPNARTGARLLVPEAPAGATPRSSAPPGYYELYDLVSLQFPKVRMVGQAPFVGYTVADFAPGSEPEVSVDTSLLTASEEPEYFIAVAGERTVALEAYTVIELPWAEVLAASSVASAPAPSARAAEDREEERLALTEARTRLALVAAELDKLREQHQQSGRDVEARAASASALSARVVELELTGEAREGRLRELEGRSGDNHVRAERLANQIRDMEEELRRQRDRGTRLTKQLEDEKKSRTKAEVELGMIRGLSSIPPQSDAMPTIEPRSPVPEAIDAFEVVAARDRIATLTRDLDSARARILELEQDHVDTPRRLPAQTERPEAGAAAPDAKLLHRLNELESAVNAALREAAEAAAARDAALERARRGEARAHRMLELEAALVTAESARNDLLEQQRSLETQVAVEAPRLHDVHRRLAESEAHRAQTEARLTEARAENATLARRLADAQAEVARLGQQLTEARAALIPLETRLARAEQRPADLEPRLAAAQARATELESRLASTQARAAEMESRLAAGQARTPVLESRLAVAEGHVAELTARLVKAELRPVQLEAELAHALARAAEIESVRATADAAIEELTTLEGALRERGHVVTALKKDLRESERVGRELLDELTAGRASNGAITAAPIVTTVTTASILELEAQLDRLAQSAARGQADLQAASWRIAQLEREARDAAEPPAASEIQAELEAALAAARDEVAALRRTQG
jgi:predicted  nucleic acid-binding Zn-ribbon protein